MFAIITGMQTAVTSTHLDADDLERMLREKDDIIEKKSDVIAELQGRIEVLEQYLRLARQKRFGSSSEQMPNQGRLFNEVEVIADEAEAQAPEQDKPDTLSNKRGRKGLSQNLPREQVFINLPDEDKVGAIDTFYTKVKEELDIVPPKARILEYMQEKAVFGGEGQRRIESAVMPKHPIGKVMASISLLAYIVIAKYMDGLPLHRLERIMGRYGADITRTSMANWVITLSKQCQPLIHLMRAHQHAGPLIYADETRIQVHNEPGYDNTGHKQMWITVGGPPDRPSVLFEYDPSRSKEVAFRLLEGYKGYVQTDGYGGYAQACRQPDIIWVGCWDHARRKFKEAQDGQPKNKQKDSLADIALKKIGQLYRIERQLKPLSDAQRYLERQKHSVPLLNELKCWLDANKDSVPKDTLTGKAFTYLSNQWSKLIRYCDDGQLRMSNIIAENAIRPFVIGRKAWLFANTPGGARASAVFYSLVETAKANKIDPHEYLCLIFKALPYADTVEKLEELMPWNVKDELNSSKRK